MINAMKRIDELQQETIDKAKEIEGASEYIKKKLELYDKDEELRNNLKTIHLKEMKIANEFFAE
jgi:triacylglycerol esterase/lipase EstA (alpha/beta hydrolase family)